VFQQKKLTVKTRGRGTYEITTDAQNFVRDLCFDAGLLNIFITHTSASLVVTENADNDVRTDLETIFAELAPDGDARYLHDAEGPDDMSAHVRSVLTQTSLSIPFQDKHLQLGTWQGLFLWEHRTRPHSRRLIFSAVA